MSYPTANGGADIFTTSQCSVGVMYAEMKKDLLVVYIGWKRKLGPGANVEKLGNKCEYSKFDYTFLFRTRECKSVKIAPSRRRSSRS